MKKIHYIIFATLLVLMSEASAQVNTLNGPQIQRNQQNTSRRNSSTGNNQEQDSVQEQTAKGIVFNTDIPDSVLLGGTYIFRYVPGSVWINQVEFPSFSAAGLNFFDRLDRIDGNFYLSKGGLGLSHYNIYPTLAAGLDWYFQPDVNIGYTKTPANVAFYQTKRPFTQLGYASSLNSEYQLKVAHTQNITPRWNASFDIDFINPDAIYANSQAKNSHVDFTTNYYSADARYQLYAGVIWQRMIMGENGGLSSDSIFTNSSQSSLSGLPVNFAYRYANFTQLTTFAHQSYNFVRQVQQVRQRVRYEIIDSATIDTIYYNDTIQPAEYKTLNKGVLALDLNWNKWRHSLNNPNTVQSATGTLYWTNDAYSDARWDNPFKISIGVSTQYNIVNEKDSITYNILCITPYASIVKKLWRGKLGALLEHDIGDDYAACCKRLLVDYRLPIDSIRKLTTTLTYQDAETPFFFNHYHSNGLHWDGETANTKTFKADIAYSKTNRIDWNISASHIVNHAWLTMAPTGTGTVLRPTQDDTPFWLLQARLIYHLKLWGWLCYDMQQMLQYSSDEEQMRVPLWATKNSLYTDIPVFKKALTIQLGLDLRYHTLFYADAYSAEAGAFYHQNEVKVGNYLWGDIFVNLQLKRAVIYAKAGHLNSLWESHPNYFILPHFPGNKFGIYYGVVWKFFD